MGNQEWIKRKEADTTVFYKSSAIEEFGPTSSSPIGRIVKIRESDTRVIEVLMTDYEIDEIFNSLDLRQHLKLAAVGYISPEEREQNAKALSILTKRTEE